MKAYQKTAPTAMNWLVLLVSTITERDGKGVTYES